MAFAPPPAEAHHYEERPLQPGGMVAVSGSWCTLNLVFEDAQGGLYLGSAAHCFRETGEPVYLHGIGEVGTVVFRDYVGRNDPTDALYKDFALIQVHPEHHGLVNPEVRFWGGPTGVEEEFAPNTPTLNYGQGGIYSTTEPTRPRAGILHHSFEDGSNNNGDRYTGWYSATHPIEGGDSGGLLLTDEGRAIGVIARAAEPSGEDGRILGPTFKQILQDLKSAGFELDVVTAPFHGGGAAALAGTVADSALHCANEPGLGAATSNACIRYPLPWTWDADVRVLGQVADTNEPPVNHDWGDRVRYTDSFGAAYETPGGILGVGTNAASNSGAYTTRAASGVTVTLEDSSGASVFFTICVHRDTAPGHCSERLAENAVASGLDQVTLRTDIPAGTWINVYPYSTYTQLDGTTHSGTRGTMWFSFQSA